MKLPGCFGEDRHGVDATLPRLADHERSFFSLKWKTERKKVNYHHWTEPNVTSVCEWGRSRAQRTSVVTFAAGGRETTDCDQSNLCGHPQTTLVFCFFFVFFLCAAELRAEEWGAGSHLLLTDVWCRYKEFTQQETRQMKTHCRCETFFLSDIFLSLLSFVLHLWNCSKI